MSLEIIYIARHGFRSNWVVDPSTGDYRAFVRTPTGNPADPALTSHGVDQARELGSHLAAIEGQRDTKGALLPVERVYCSPYYRCLQTVQPFVEAGMEAGSKESVLAVRCDPGLVDWFGPAPFEHPQPAPVAELRARFFPWIDEAYGAGGEGEEKRSSGITPSRQGESMAQLHARVAACLGHIVRQCDADGIRAVLVCSHAASIIAMGRALTGEVPADVETTDFGVFTCGLSVFRRRARAGRTGGQDAHRDLPWDLPWDPLGTLAGQPWTGGRGIEGGWDCEVNCDCSFLSGGEERGWRFSGDDESFYQVQNQDDSRRKARKEGPIVDAGLELGVVVQGRRAEGAVRGSAEGVPGSSDVADHSADSGSGSGRGQSGHTSSSKTTSRL